MLLLGSVPTAANLSDVPALIVIALGPVAPGSLTGEAGETMVPFGAAGLGATTALARIRRAVAARDVPPVQFVAPVTAAVGAPVSRLVATWQGAEGSVAVTDQAPLAEAFVLATTAFESALRTDTSESGVAVPLTARALDAGSQVALISPADSELVVEALAAFFGTVPSPHPVRALASTNAEAKATYTLARLFGLPAMGVSGWFMLVPHRSIRYKMAAFAWQTAFLGQHMTHAGK